MDKKYYPLAFIFFIAVAIYIMYGGYVFPKVDLQKYKEVCTQYRAAAVGTYSDEEIQSLVFKVNYLFPGKVEELTDPLEKEIKTCSNELAARLQKK